MTERSTEEVRSDVTGSVWKITTEVGQEVEEGDEIMIVESMKMEIPILAPRSGLISEHVVAEETPIVEGDVVARITTR